MSETTIQSSGGWAVFSASELWMLRAITPGFAPPPAAQPRISPRFTVWHLQNNLTGSGFAPGFSFRNLEFFFNSFGNTGTFLQTVL